MQEAACRLRSRNALLVCGGVELLLGAGGEELRAACASAEPLVALAAGQGVLWLAARGALDPQRALSDLLALLPAARNHAAIISTMGGLLVLELKSRLVSGQPYVCQLSLKSPQHPFITVLERNLDVAQDVLAQMQAMCFQPDYTIAQNSLELLRAVFLWLLCNPHDESSLRWRQPCWQLLLSVGHKQRSELEREALLWQQMSSPAHLQAAFTVFSALADSAFQQNKIEEYVVGLVPVLARLSNHFVRLGKDPRACYNVIDRLYTGRIHQFLQWTSIITVPLLAENLLTSPSVYLHELFTLCYKIITTYVCPSVSINILVAYSLQWLHSPSCLTAEALKVAEKILLLYQEGQQFHAHIGMKTLYTNTLFRTLLHTDRRLFVVFQQMKAWEMAVQKNKVESWLEAIEIIVDKETKLEFVLILLGIFMEKKLAPAHALRVLKLLLGMVRTVKDYTVLMLPILVYKVTNDPSPSVQLECLKAIPQMAHTKENVPTIVGILNRLKLSAGAPSSLLLHLYTGLVEVQGRCYPYLQEMLLDGAAANSPIELKWETEIAKADAVKTICLSRAGTYGAELVSVLSGLLNRCTDPSGVIASSLALEALKVLWNERIVSPSSTWYALAPKMNRDKRPAVHVSLCKLLGEVPHLRVQTPEYDKFVTDAARRLWTYMADSHHPEVIVAACEALANYKLEDYTLKDVPEVYRKGVKLPASHCKTPVDAARNPEDVLDYIPSEIWPSVFKNTNQSALPGVQTLVCAYMEREIKSYRSGIYAADTRGSRAGEPDNLRYLPPHSVVQGMMEYVRKQGTSPSYECPDSLYLTMLECLTRDYPRPLPPLEMCFLHELFHRGAHFHQPCLLLAARQALLSGTAKRFLENYLMSAEAGEDKEGDILMLFEMLPALARSTAPNVLRTPLEKYIDYAYTKMVQSKQNSPSDERAEEILFVRQLELMRACLESDKIHDANRTLLSQFVENYWPLLADDSVAWETYARTCCALSSTVLERITSPSSWWESTPELVRKVASVRARLACADSADTPLVWLNEIIDAAVTCPSEHMFVLRAVAEPLRRARVDQFTREWLLQLMARAQISIADSQATDVAALTFLCDVYMLSVVLISGYHALECDGLEVAIISREARCLVFPSAVASLVGDDRPKEWQNSAVQIIEWLQHTRSVTGIPDKCRSAFYHGLVACRHSTHLINNNTWRRILSVRHDHDS